MPPRVLELRRASRLYSQGQTIVRALDNVSLVIRQGEFVCVLGTSGSGKSTLLQIAGCLDRPTSGVVLIERVDTSRLNERQLAFLRGRKLGFIFQSFNLLTTEPAWRNVELPLQYQGVPARERRQRAIKALGEVGLGKRVDHKPSQLSGGQRQRVAIARALVNDPLIILADEPTGALDTRTTADVMAVLQRLNKRGRTIVMVTHEESLTELASRVIRIEDGQIKADEKQSPQLVPDSRRAPEVVEQGPVCMRCNRRNRPVSRFCRYCGFSLTPDEETTERVRLRLSGVINLESRCSNCGRPNRSLSKVCRHCGTRLLEI